MIEAKELRIGNLVTCLGKEVELIGISKWNGNNYTTLHYAEFKGMIPIQLFHLKPIPLTEEWLFKFGFKKLSSPEATFSNEYMIIYTHESTGFYYFEYGIGENKKAIRRSECRYVHQLQNLYHSLTNEELTLNN